MEEGGEDVDENGTEEGLNSGMGESKSGGGWCLRIVNALRITHMFFRQEVHDRGSIFVVFLCLVELLKQQSSLPFLCSIALPTVQVNLPGSHMG